MIVDFSIANFRSIKDKQLFSLYAENSSTHLKNNIAYPAGNKIGVLRSSGIYGANASGKSNLLLAFEALRYIVGSSGDLKDGDPIQCYEPYRLSDSTKNANTSFEIEFFTEENIRFIYSVTFNSTTFVKESLDFYPGIHKANIFKRDVDQSWEDISFGGQYKGGKKKFAFFENNSYLSKAGNSADSPPIIRSVYNFFRRGIIRIGASETVMVMDWQNNIDFVNKISNILSMVDTGISGIKFEKNENSSELKFPEDIPNQLKKFIVKSNEVKTLFTHKTENGDLEFFDKKYESSGTIKLFNLLPILMNALDEGHVLILDELDNSFHPHIAELIIKILQDPAVNKNNAQLIFTTHNINLMSSELLRRDQLWFTEKTNGATTLYSLDEYDKKSVRNNSPYSKWYDEGRFGAIPNIDIHKLFSTFKNN